MIIDTYINTKLRPLSKKYYNELLSDTELTKYNKQKLQDAMNCFILNAAREVKSNKDTISIVLKESYYSEPIIVNGNKVPRSVSFTYMMKVFEWLEESKECVINRGGEIDFVNLITGEIKRTQSSLILSESIIEDMQKYKEDKFIKLENVLELRDKDKKPMVFEKRAFENKVIKTLNKYNNNSRKFIVASGSGTVYDVQAKRIFNETFDSGGRMYLENGSIQGINKEDRPELTIDGERTIELDYKALHPSILYDYIGVECSLKDPYGIHIEGYDKSVLRDLAKIAILIVFNCKSRSSAIGAFNKEIATALDLNDLKKTGRAPYHIKSGELIDAMMELHEPISHYFFSGIGSQLQKADSDVMEYITDVFAQSLKLAIPIHDSIIIKESDSDLGFEVMQRAYLDVVGTDMNCKIEQKW